MARYLVTGGAGFIGSNIVHALLERGDRVVVLDDFSSGRTQNLENLKGQLEVEQGSVCDAQLVERVVKHSNGIFHHAAKVSVPESVLDPVGYDEVNAHGTITVLQAAKSMGVQRIVYAASSAAYGDNPELPKRESLAIDPLSPYAVSKLAGEYYVRVFSQLFGMRGLSLRYFNVYGPRQNPQSDYAAVIPKFMQRLLQKKNAIIYGDGTQTRDFCYIADIVAANLLAMDCQTAHGQTINIAGGSAITIRQLASELATLTHLPDEPHFEPERPGDILHSVADISQAKALLGYTPRYSIQDGLRLTLDYYKTQKT